MTTKWILFVSAVAFGSAIIFSMPEDDGSSTVKSTDAGVTPQAVSGDSVIQSTRPAVFRAVQSTVAASDSQQQAQMVSEQAPVSNPQAETGMQSITPDAFPDTSTLSADQRGESEVTDEAELEAERNAIDLYFPVEEQTDYQLTEVEAETQRLQLEAEIATQADAREHQLSLSESDFDMPAEEY